MIKRLALMMMGCIFLGAGLAGAQAVKDDNSKMTMPDGSVYQGQLKDGVFNGHGQLDYPDGRQYVGDFKDGLFDGNGVFLYTDGSKYEGQFREGALNGDGLITYADGTQYKGIFKDGDTYVAPPVDISSVKYLKKG